MESVNEANQCVKTEMIAWVSYPAYKNFCFVYPRYQFDTGKWKVIDAAAFPNNGSFFSAIKGGADSSEIEDTFGSIVVARVNADRFPVSNRYNPTLDSSTYYQLVFNPTFSKGKSELELTLFSEHSMSADLVQIVDARTSVSFSEPFEIPIGIINQTDSLVCRSVLVRNAADEYFGPFDYVVKDENQIVINAPSSNSYKVAQFDAFSSDSILTIRDDNNDVQCEFVERCAVDSLFKEAEQNEELFDWMPRSEYVDVVVRAINASDEFSNLGKNQLRGIKAAIRDFGSGPSQIALDDARKQRIIDWLSQIDSLVDLPSQVIDGLIASVSEEKIFELMQDERYFSRFKDRIIEHEGIQEAIAEERKRQEESLLTIKEQRENAERKRLEAEAAAREAQEKANEARRQYEKVRNEAIDQKREEINRLDNTIEKRSAEVERLNSEYERLIVNKNSIERQVEKIIGGINDEVTASTKILESEILRKVVAAVSGVDFREDDLPPVTDYGALRADEESMRDEDIVDVIYDSITRRAGRQITKNDVINYLICLTQGFITTFAGLPGTGKTSLCGILAGVLGLMNDGAGRRFTEINVENGWTSYKDYVGYYNPLAKTYEKANASVYDAMRMLSNESHGSSGIPPYVFLLDEANLSPIEHYWSPFLRACDTFQEDGVSLSLGGMDEWRLPNRVRFLATVNFDHTTEALSHRFLDRSWVITLDSGFVDSDFEHVNIAKEFANENAFSSDRLFQAFGYGESCKPNQDNMQLLDELVRVCKSHSFPISPRSQLMMKRYIATASRLMSLQSKDSQYAPLDYAFSQKILPLISGPTEIVGELVEVLSEKCSQLKVTKRQLDRMWGFGKDSGFYQYFI